MEFNNYDEILKHYLTKGAFVTSGADKVNVMTASWGMVGVMWGKRVVMLPVRQSRYTKEFIDKTGEFTLSIPFDKMQKELTFCGTKSGREVDKFEALGMEKVKADKVDTYKVGGCDAYLECRVITEFTLSEGMLTPEIVDRAYKSGDYHTMYIAEILE